MIYGFSKLSLYLEVNTLRWLRIDIVEKNFSLAIVEFFTVYSCLQSLVIERLQNHLCASYCPGEGFCHRLEPWMKTERCVKGLESARRLCKCARALGAGGRKF